MNGGDRGTKNAKIKACLDSVHNFIFLNLYKNLSSISYTLTEKYVTVFVNVFICNHTQHCGARLVSAQSVLVGTQSGVYTRSAGGPGPSLGPMSGLRATGDRDATQGAHVRSTSACHFNRRRLQPHIPLYNKYYIINRPGVAGAVLQTPS